MAGSRLPADDDVPATHMGRVVTGINVRDAVAGDFATIAEFNAAMARETEALELDRRVLDDGVAAVLEDPAKGRYFVAELDTHVVGQAMVTTEWSDWRNGDFWWFQSVYVQPQARGKGVFASLYKHIEAAARAAGVRGLRLYVDEANTRAQDVYARLGMHESQYKMMETDFIIDRRKRKNA